VRLYTMVDTMLISVPTSSSSCSTCVI
jgi:hypothetical protein